MSERLYCDHDDVVLYHSTLKETFPNEPAKVNDFFTILQDLKHNRITDAEAISEIQDLMKDHLMLLLGFSAFYVLQPKTIPREAYMMLDQFQTTQTRVGKRVSPVLTLVDALYYISSVRDAFISEHAKLNQFVKILLQVTAGRTDDASAIAKMEELMKGHQNLALGFRAFLSADPRKTIPPKTQPHNNRRKRARLWWSRICEQV